ncbi:glycerol-3-phosphate 1-O-acyltransferase PlsY [Lacibacterium aquatile]|uniref:Glycerol-3-phosphate acyltransferase n=1 Tax=Lacibacterium aquatile TaxID=1168082 RepID=A0ABW5DV21_9PROT
MGLTLYTLVALVGGYLVGSIPFGLLLTKAAGLGDIRAIGSGNIGATNVLRTGNKPLAAATLLLDGGKGAVAVLLAGWLYGADAALAAGLGAVLGHLFPVWLKFNGGKGVATTLGVWLALAWPVGLIAIATWILTALVTRISSLSALVAIAVSPIAAWVLLDVRYGVVGILIAALVYIRHHENIRRLLSGTEPKIGKKK